MQEKQVLERAFAMPLISPAYPPGPYRFVNREYLIITYRTDPAKLRAVVPEPLEFDEQGELSLGGIRPSRQKRLRAWEVGTQLKASSWSTEKIRSEP
jgi:Acetoacetate decarboxylase (ADC)